MFFLVVLAVGGTGCARAGGQPFQPTSNTALVLDDGVRVGQTINPVGPVTGVDLNVATFGAPADATGVLTVTIAELPQATAGQGDDGVLASTRITGSDLTDGTWTAARFDADVEVDGVALVEASWDGAEPIALWANTTQEGTEGLANDPYAAGHRVVDGRPREGDLAFRVVGSTGPDAAAAQAVEVGRSAAARLADQPVFTVLWMIALAGAVALAVRGLRSR